MSVFNQSNGKRLFKNTIYMYVRMAFLMVVSLYTSRVILQKLGVEDYGIYNVVGSVVGLFVSLKSMFTGATQRFLNYEMGSGHPEKLSIIFNTSTIVNWGLGILFVVLVESVGLWFLNDKINVEPDRLYATYCVFHLSVLSTFISIISIPYDACIIAHERMDFYAFTSIFEGLAKLGICYVLTWWNSDRLILYACLMLAISVILRVVNVCFCKYHFQECHFRLEYDRSYLQRMSTYAGWAFFGNTSFAVSASGLNMILNVFGGPVVNAARGITMQVSAAIAQFVGNITLVLRPCLGKVWASGEQEKAFRISFLSSKLYFLIQIFFVTLFTFFSDRILHLWLGVVPEYTIVFLNIVLWQSLAKSLHYPIDIIFAGKGNIKYYQLSEGVILLLPVPAAYVLLKLGCPYYSAFLACLVAEILHIIVIAYICKRVCGFPLGKYYSSVICPCIMCAVIYAVSFIACGSFITSFAISMTLFLFTIIVLILCMYQVGLKDDEKKILMSIVAPIKKK